MVAILITMIVQKQSPVQSWDDLMDRYSSLTHFAMVYEAVLEQRHSKIVLIDSRYNNLEEARRSIDHGRRFLSKGALESTLSVFKKQKLVVQTFPKAIGMRLEDLKGTEYLFVVYSTSGQLLQYVCKDELVADP